MKAEIAKIGNMIHTIKGHKVMLDSDLAELYGVTTKVLNQAVKRNIRRFPNDFMFQLTKDEAMRLRSQFVTLKRGEHMKYLPNVFTEQGIAMLSGVLNSQRAVDVNVAIMRTFVRLRGVFSSQNELAKKLDNLERTVEGHNRSIHEIFQAIRQIMTIEAKPKPKIGFFRK